MSISSGDPASVAQAAAVLAGASLSRAQAERIASAVLSHADGKLMIEEAAWREYWDMEDFRAHLRQTMRHRLLDGILEQGYVPTGQPSETVRYVMTSALPGATRMNGDGTPAAGVEVTESSAWDTVNVVLQVAVRVPASA